VAARARAAATATARAATARVAWAVARVEATEEPRAAATVARRAVV